MTREVIDILPVKKIKPSHPKPKVQHFPLFGIFLFLFLVGILVLSFNFSKAEVRVWPKVEKADFGDKIIVSSYTQEINFLKKEIPGKIFEFEKEIEKSFPATGKALKKAEGVIRLYNSFTTKNETWKAQTRFVSSEGKVFLSKEKIEVPGAKIENGKIVPSFVDVPVVAAEGGNEYNIGPSKFAIPAFKGTERYFKYYGESFQPMKGGGEVTVVSSKDLEEGLKKLEEWVVKENPEEILGEIPENFFIPKEGVFVEILEKSFDKKEGAEADQFSIKAKLKIKVLGIERRILKSFLEREFYSKLKGKILFSKEKIDASLGTRDFQGGKFLLNLNVSTFVSQSLDVEKIKKEIAGKSLKEAIESLKKENIEKAKIKIFPFWSFQVPENLEKIDVVVQGVD